MVKIIFDMEQEQAKKIARACEIEQRVRASFFRYSALKYADEVLENANKKRN